MFHLLLGVIYISFISLGLPDSLLGAAWPSMYAGLHVPISFAGALSMIIAAGTVISSLQSDRLTRKFGTGKVTLFSVAVTALALFGFSASKSFWMLCIWAAPYGLGAGSVDASLNHYVALHYASRHMSWLHCMWGVGASLGPYVMGHALAGRLGWNSGYRYIAILQIALTAVLLFSLPLWKEKETVEKGADSRRKILTLREIGHIPGAREVMLTFFCYSGLEQTTGLWAGSYLTLQKGLSVEAAAAFSSFFFLGITVGRALGGFLTMRRSDSQMVRLGQGLAGAGILAVLLPIGEGAALLGLILIGLGCAPIYPCMIHSTPDYFGVEQSQAIIGVQMASAYVGTCLLPPVFGLLAQHITSALFPVYLLLDLALLFAAHERLLRIKAIVNADA